MVSLTSRGAECIAGRIPPVTQTTSSLPAEMHAASSSRQRSTPRRALRQRWAASPTGAGACTPLPPTSPPDPPEASEARRSSTPSRSSRSTMSVTCSPISPPRPGGKPTVLALGKQLLETGRRAEDRLDRPGRCRVISSLSPAACRSERSPCRRRERTQASGADVHSERGGKDVLELMGLVDDERVVLRQHLSPTSQISAEKMKVHDDDVRGGRPRTSCLREALAAEGQRRAPGHSSAVTLTLDHAGTEGSNSSSARSPLAVDPAQAARRRTSSPIRRAAIARAEPLGRAPRPASDGSALERLHVRRHIARPRRTARRAAAARRGARARRDAADRGSSTAL